MYDRILFTESRVVESKIKEFKKPTNASMHIVESGCDLCTGGEYPPDEDIQLPPFHPNCNCTHYYETTDNEDDINDLDLELEERYNMRYAGLIRNDFSAAPGISVSFFT